MLKPNKPGSGVFAKVAFACGAIGCIAMSVYACRSRSYNTVETSRTRETELTGSESKLDNRSRQGGLKGSSDAFEPQDGIPWFELASGGALPTETLLCRAKSGTPLVRFTLEEAPSSEHRGAAFVHRGPGRFTELLAQTDVCYEENRVKQVPALPAWAAGDGTMTCGSVRHMAPLPGAKGTPETTLTPNRRGVRVFLLRAASGAREARIEGGGLPSETFPCVEDTASP